MLIPVDVGNAMTKFRSNGGVWTAEPSTVRRYQPSAFSTAKSVRPFVYHAGPARLSSEPVVIGADALAHGGNEMALSGTANQRIATDSYFLLHLFGIVASLPKGETEADVVFAGGLPMQDYSNKANHADLKARLLGTHSIQWGKTTYTITITTVYLRPQPVCAVATMIYDSNNRLITDAPEALRFAVDIGGGTTDVAGCKGITIDSPQAGFVLGVWDAIKDTTRLVAAAHPLLHNVSDSVSDAVFENRKAPAIWIAGRQVSIKAEWDSSLRTVADAIARRVIGCIGLETIPTGEIVLFGGGGQLFAPYLKPAFARMTTIIVAPSPFYAVVAGLEMLILAKFPELAR